MHIGERGTHGVAIVGCRMGDIVAGKPAHQDGGLAFQLSNDGFIGGHQWCRASHAIPMQMRHQSHVEIEILPRDFFENGENVTPFSGGDKKIRILDARGDVLEIDNVADAIWRDERASLNSGDGGKDAHRTKIFAFFTM